MAPWRRSAFVPVSAFAQQRRQRVRRGFVGGRLPAGRGSGTYRTEGAGMTRANRAEMSWDGEKRGWVVRVIVGEEVIKRRCRDVSQAATDEELRTAALRVAADEGFDLAPEAVAIRK